MISSFAPLYLVLYIGRRMCINKCYQYYSLCTPKIFIFVEYLMSTENLINVGDDSGVSGACWEELNFFFKKNSRADCTINCTCS